MKSKRSKTQNPRRPLKSKSVSTEIPAKSPQNGSEPQEPPIVAGNPQSPASQPRITHVPGGKIGEFVWKRVEGSNSFIRTGVLKPLPRQVHIFVDRGAGWDDGLFRMGREAAILFIETIIYGRTIDAHSSKDAIQAFKIKPFIESK